MATWEIKRQRNNHKTMQNIGAVQNIKETQTRETFFSACEELGKLQPGFEA